MSAPKYDLNGIFDPATAHPADAHSQLMRLIPPNSRVLELGCATGYLSGHMVQKLGCTVTGLEADTQSARIAGTRATTALQVDLDQPDALQRAGAHGPFDVVLAAAVLEHLRAPGVVLRAARALLAPGGQVIVSLPNIAHWRARLALLCGRFDYQEYGLMDRTHVHFYTLKTGRELLEASGFQVFDVRIAGSAVQNVLSRLRGYARQTPLILPGLLAYEMIFITRPEPSASDR